MADRQNFVKRRLAFCLLQYFPYGGLERDFLKMALAAQAQGAEIHVYTAHWRGDLPAGFILHELPVRAWTNHGRMWKFSKILLRALQATDYDKIIGFHKLPGLDIYYAADHCFAAKKHSFFLRCMPRYRCYRRLEAAVFSPGKKTEIFCLTPSSKAAYQKTYGTEEERFTLLSPGISRAYQRPSEVSAYQAALRKEYGIPEDALICLMIASRFHTKGVDRAVKVIQDLNFSVHLIVVGDDRAFSASPNIHFAGPQAEVSRFLWGADLLVHPARQELAGLVLLEALVAGLPVISTEICGYAPYIEAAHAGIILPEPYRQQDLQRALDAFRDPQFRAACSAAALAYAAKTDLCSVQK